MHCILVRHETTRGLVLSPSLSLPLSLSTVALLLRFRDVPSVEHPRNFTARSSIANMHAVFILQFTYDVDKASK